jgi:hypothetical protein
MKACPICKELKASGDLQSNGYCVPCGSNYRKQHYERNKQKYKSKAKDWNKKVELENNTYMVNYLKSNPCVDCGETDPVVLEFDHVNPDEKLFDISQGKFKSSPKVFQNEIEKCQVRCANCHRRKTAIERGWIKNYQ